MEDNTSARWNWNKKYKPLILFVWDLFICVLWVIPLYIQWIIQYLSPREKKCVKGKVALITGAAQGLGKAMAIKLANLGCNIAIADINKGTADQTAEEISNKGVTAKAYCVDITKSDEILKLRSDILRDFGAVDILINNAGIISVTNLEEDPAHIAALINVNLLGLILVTKYFFETMKSQGSGHIVSISSMAGVHASPYIITYSAAKFGVNGFMQGLNEHIRMEKLNDKIKTTCVFPYYINTQPAIKNFLHPNIRIPALEVESAAKKIVKAILQEKTNTTIPENFELGVRIANFLPLKIQQKLFRDKMLEEYNFKNPDF